MAVAALSGGAPGSVKALQAVTVKLGPDGSTTNVGVTMLTESGGHTTTTTSVLDPQKTVSKLPVRVAVSYVAGTKSGTDLRRFTGATGPVEMDVTVTNNTVHPEAFTADYAASHGSTYALVGTPMTVVATATLPKASVLSVTTPPTAADAPHTTNGIVGRNSSGDTTVQWTALLAPPRLAPTSTFRLVVDASKFALGGLNISVEPGLQTDPSVAHLLDDALGAGQVSQVDQQTVALVSDIDSNLQDTSRALDLLRSRLSNTAGTEGNAATESLTGASSSLKESSVSLSQEISALQSSVGGTLTTGSTGSQTLLRTTVNSLITYLGLPASGQPLPTSAPSASTASSTGCRGSIDLAVKPASSLLAQLGQTADALHEIALDGTGCEQAAVASLDATIGDPAAACPAAGTAKAPASLNCLLGATSTSLTDASAQIASEDVAIEAGFDRDYTTNTLNAIGTLGGDLANVKQFSSDLTSAIDAGGAKLSTAAGYLNQADTAIDSLNADLKTVSEGTPGDGGSPGSSQASAAAANASASASDAAALTGQETQQLSTASPSAGATPGLGYVASQLAKTVCTVPTITASPTDTPSLSSDDQEAVSAYLKSLTDTLNAQQQTYSDQLHQAITGTVCDPKDPGTVSPSNTVNSLIGSLGKTNDSVASDVASVQTSLGSLKAFLANAVAGLGAAKTAASSIATEVSQAAAPVGAQATDQSAGSPKGVQASADALQASLGALSSISPGPAPSTVPSGSPCPTATPSGPPLDNIQAGTLITACNTQTVMANLHGLIASVSPTLVAASAQVSQAAAGAQNVKTAADKQLATLLNGLTSEVSGAADAEYSTGAAAFSTQRDTLNKSLTQLVGNLDTASKTAVADLDTTTKQAVSSQDAATKALVGEVEDVLTDLGNGKAQTGLLGAVNEGAVQAGVGNDSVADASVTANNFSAVRAAEQNGIRLGNEVNDRSLAEVPSYTFGTAVPPGTKLTSVFDYELVG